MENKRGEVGDLYSVQIWHDHAVDTQGNVLSRDKCPICSDPEVLELIKAERARVRAAVEGMRKPELTEEECMDDTDAYQAVNNWFAHRTIHFNQATEVSRAVRVWNRGIDDVLKLLSEEAG